MSNQPDYIHYPFFAGRVAARAHQERKFGRQIHRVQIMRTAGKVSREKAACLIFLYVEDIALLRMMDDRQLKGISDRLEALISYSGEALIDKRLRLEDRWERLTDERYAQVLDEFAEHELTRLFRHDRANFDQLFERGRAAIFGPFRREHQCD